MANETKVMALINELQPRDLLKYLIKKAPSSFGEVLDKAHKHMDCEDIFLARVARFLAFPRGRRNVAGIQTTPTTMNASKEWRETNLHN